MFILKKEHQPGVYVPLRALFLVSYGISVEFGNKSMFKWSKIATMPIYFIRAYNH